MYKIYTDGSCNCSRADKPGGWGVYILHDEEVKYLNGGLSHTSIGRMEIMAMLNALRHIDDNIPTKDCEVNIYTDSKYVSDTLTKGWLRKWQQANWPLSLRNLDLWQQISNTIESISRRGNINNVKIIHIRGHQKDITNEDVFGNHIADILANYKAFTSHPIDNKL